MHLCIYYQKHPKPQLKQTHPASSICNSDIKGEILSVVEAF